MALIRLASCYSIVEAFAIMVGAMLEVDEESDEERGVEHVESTSSPSAT